ncbi:hypothetical protein HDU79_004648 [Rhizoclosmatium sp. JEL0117]|nr:hypothetical protein HDU79_004648 [Rhizoclosmatium sp. JEL0117]
MPSIIKLRIHSARNLPVMDRATELTDAFVEAKFSDYDQVRTKTCRRTLSPTWNEDFRIEVSNDADLQNEPLEIKVMDYDQIGYSDAIGGVFVDLNPLLAWDSTSRDSTLSGWFPIFDSLRGICGEILITVKLNFFGDSNQYSDSSTAVQFFTTPAVPPMYIVTGVLGYVSTLEREDDPEYHWADNFRTPRTSNDARMRIMYRLSGQLRRQLGKKVENLGGNAVLGYKQYFDFETEHRSITARAIGTAVTLATPEQVMATIINSPSLAGELGSFRNLGTGGVSFDANAVSSMTPTATGIPLDAPFQTRTSSIFSPAGTTSGPTTLPQLSTTRLPIVESPGTSPTENLPPPLQPLPTSTAIKQIDQYPVTLTTFPPNTLLGLGGLVCATSVKILDNSTDNKESRDIWWQELRDEIKSHARSLGCPLIVGYTEQMTVCEELVVCYCYGTAAVVDLNAFGGVVPAGTLAAMPVGGAATFSKSRVASSSGSMDNIGLVGYTGASNRIGTSGTYDDMDLPIPSTPAMVGRSSGIMSFNQSTAAFMEKLKKKRKKKRMNPGCQACHITVSRADSYQNNTTYTRCGVCKKKFVPEILLSTIEPPAELETIGKSVMIEAHVCRIKKSRGESHAVIVSESMPFAQYDIHRQLLFKLRIHGLNAIFGLKIQYSIGESLMTAVATGTAVYLKALPPPAPLKLLRTLEVEDAEDRQLVEDQRRIMEQSELNRRQIEAALAQDLEIQQRAAIAAMAASMESFGGRKSGLNDVRETEGVPQHRDSGVSNEEAESDSDSDDSVSSDSDAEYEVAARGQRNVVVQIDDEHDEDLVLMMDAQFRDGFQIKNIESAIKSEATDTSNLYTVQSISMVRQGFIPLSSHHPNRQLAKLFQDLYQELQFQFSYVNPCVIVGVDYDIQVLKLNEIQIRLTGVALGVAKEGQDESLENDIDEETGSLCLSDRAPSPSRKSMSKNQLNLGPRQMTNTSVTSLDETDKKESDEESETDDDLMYSDDELEEVKLAAGGMTTGSIPNTPAALENTFPIPGSGLNPTTNTSSPSPNRLPSSITGGLVSFAKKETSLVQVPRAVEITPLSYVPQSRIEKFLGRVSLHFVKEASILYEVGTVGGGMGGFAHTFLAEFYAVARAYTVALGGNAMISFTVEESMFYESIKNQGYSLISVSGDVVQVAHSPKRKAIYESNQKHQHSVLLGGL